MEALRASGWLEGVAAIQPEQLTYPAEALPPLPVVSSDPASTLEADLADVLAQLERLDVNENPMERAAQQDTLLEQQSLFEEELKGLATSAPVLDAEQAVAADPDACNPPSPDTTVTD